MRHGIFTTETATALSVPKEASFAIVGIGCAPVNMLEDPQAAVNQPILASSATEAMLKLGYSMDFANYGLCELMYATTNVCAIGPLVLINVLDPAKHKKALAPTQAAVEMYRAKVPVSGILRDGLTVSAGEGETAQQLTEGLDYSLTFDTVDGGLIIDVAPEGAGAEAVTLTVSGSQLDPSMVTEADVIGSIDIATGQSTGLELIRYIKPRFSILGNLLVAPGFSQMPAVAVALAAKADAMNSKFKAMAICDVDSDKARKREDAKKVKEDSGMTTNRIIPVWPEVKVGSYQLHGSSVLAAFMAYQDAENGGVPYTSPSNYTLGITGTCLHDGTEVVLDSDTASVLDDNGITTFFNDDGWRMWGDYTGAAPSEGDPKDLWICCRRMLDYCENNFLLSYAYLVDRPMNRALIDNIINTQNQIFAGLVSSRKIAFGEATYSVELNPKSDIIAGRMTIKNRVSFWTPARDIEGDFSFDVDKLAEALAA